MNDQGREWIRRLSLGLLLPVLLFLAAVLHLTRPPGSQLPHVPEPTEPASPDQNPIMLKLKVGEEIQQLELEAYLQGVVLAEMPASFAIDALRAQAVAARTYTMKHCRSGRHGENTLCADPGCCQAYIAPESYVLQGGSWGSVQRVCGAVKDTAGEVLVYSGDLIDATYFSCAGGRTEDAQSVWGQYVPYLQSVPSPGEEATAHYSDSKTFSADGFQQALGIRLYGPVSAWFSDVTLTDGGGVDRITIGGVAYRGTTIRTLLGLRSTAFSVSYTDDTVTFHTRGFGHRVGMSQYGANAMALEGKTYRQILQHYYPGTVLEEITNMGAQ